MAMPFASHQSDEWDVIAETELALAHKSLVHSISQLSHLWWHFCASINRRLAGTRLLNAQNAPGDLLAQIFSKLSPIPEHLNSANSSATSPNALQLIPKCHYHNSLSDRCFEMATIAGDGEKEAAVFFRSAHLASNEKGDHLPNPHIDGTYAFYLVRHSTMADMDDETSQITTRLYLKAHRDLPWEQKEFLRKWLWLRLQKWVHKIGSSNFSEFAKLLESENRFLDSKGYADSYWRLKMNYGRQLIQEFPGNAGAIYENCAIAAYLLELWNAYGIGPRNGFVDIGCGKGLLVHLLHMEGIPGFGINRREKPQWERLKASGTPLLPHHLEPQISLQQICSDTIFAKADFLIGNRCDQLIPWIPIIAAKLSCNFFLLPTIPMNFHSKFGKRIVSKFDNFPTGKMDQYYTFLEEICAKLGFDVKIDQLKIPSKRRKCIIGIVPARGLPPKGILDPIIDQLIIPTDQESRRKEPTGQAKRRIPSTPQQYSDLCRRIIAFLISKDPNQKIGNWHSGGSSNIGEIAKILLNDNDRQMLAGLGRGLPTFLRSQRQLFCVQKGLVFIRPWPEEHEKRENNEKLADYQCNLQQTHPDGCPLMPTQCPFRHVPSQFNN